MKIYIAGKWEEHALIGTYAQRLEAAGHTITLPWFRLHLVNVDLPKAAAEDVQGVADATTCIFIFERVLPYKGAMTELGLAIAQGKRIIIVGTGGDSCIFAHLRGIQRVSTFDEAMEIL